MDEDTLIALRRELEVARAERDVARAEADELRGQVVVLQAAADRLRVVAYALVEAGRVASGGEAQR